MIVDNGNGDTKVPRQQRSTAIQPWIDAYNLTRPHAGIGYLSPWQKLNNLLGNDS